VPDVEGLPEAGAALARAPAGPPRSLDRVRRVIERAEPGAGLPQLLVAEAASAAGAAAGVLCAVSGDRLMELAWVHEHPAREGNGGASSAAGLPLALGIVTAASRPVWLTSRAELVRRFPGLAGLAAAGEQACAVLPLRADGGRLGAIALMFAGQREFAAAEREYLMDLADLCAVSLRRQSRPAGPPPLGPPPLGLSAARLEELVDALARAESADSVATVIAERGAAAGASFANVAVLDPGTDASARMYHSSSLRKDFEERYPAIPADGSTPLGTVLQTAGEVWLPSRSEAAASYPGLLTDFTSAGVGAVASVALTDGQQRVIGALGMAWPAAQAFTDAQKSEVRVIARLAASALRRAQQLEAERAARQRTERLQAMMRALVASASLADVHAAVFQHGLLPFGASAARLVLTGQERLGRPLTVSAVGMAEPALTEWRDLPLSAYSPSRKALVTSEIVYVPTRADLRREFPQASLIGKTPDDQAWAAVPLRRAGRTVGVLTLVFGRPHALDEVSDQIALAALGSAVADAVGRAAAHDSDRDLVSSLQRSLLAGPLPELPGARLGARYLPAEARHGMGGDWYDAIPLPGGRLMLVVGDVAGHGLEAAITMGQVRSAARALAPAHQPASLLAALDQFVCTTISEPLATAVAAVIDPARRTLRYCQAGHPPPLLRHPDGSVQVLDEASGLLLGLETSDRPECEISFSPGSGLVLYTDGLVERRDDPSVEAGITRLAAQLAGPLPPGPAELCNRLVEDGLPSQGREDDTAVLCAFLSLARCRQPGRYPGPGLKCSASHGPVTLRGSRATSSGGPAARMCPPSGPPPGPMSMRWSAAASRSRSWSMTMIVAPAASSRSNTPASVATSSGCRPVDGSSKTYSAPRWLARRRVAIRSRCDSPPDRDGVGSPSRR
jgi:serine phosphatase RsbU (regulator of sigma subunit)